MTDELNMNLAKCLQSTNDWGVTHYHNICSGKVIDVPWGAADWAGVSVLSALGFMFCLMMAGMAFVIIRD